MNKRKSKSRHETPFQDNLFIVWILFPLLFFGWAFLKDSVRTHCLGLMLVSAAQYGVCCIVVRVHSFLAEFQPSSGDSSGYTDKSILAFISWSGLISFAWAFFGCLYSPHIACDIGVPIASLVLCATAEGFFVRNISGLRLALLICGAWWTLSALYATLLRGHSRAFDAFQNHYNSENWLLGDYDVSFWTQRSVWTPLLNLVLIFVPYPSIYFSNASKHDQSSLRGGLTEDVVFIIAISNALPIILSSVWSIRFLGLLGLTFGTHHSSNFR